MNETIVKVIRRRTYKKKALIQMLKIHRQNQLKIHRQNLLKIHRQNLLKIMKQLSKLRQLDVEKELVKTRRVVNVIQSNCQT
jgi:hypothetical protein